MPQFDVHRNPGQDRAAIAVVVSPRRARFDRAGTRLAAPLLRADGAGIAEHCLAPRFVVEGVTLLPDVFNLAMVPSARLGAAVALPGDETDSARIVRALDELLSRA